MTLELLKTELDRAEDALLRSEEQLRGMVELLDHAKTPGPNADPVGAARLVAASLALNERLNDRAKRLRVETERAAKEARQ